MFELAGIAEPKAAGGQGDGASRRALAKDHWDRVKSRDRTLTYNKMDRKALDSLSPGIRLERLVQARTAMPRSTR